MSDSTDVKAIIRLIKNSKLSSNERAHGLQLVGEYVSKKKRYLSGSQEAEILKEWLARHNIHVRMI